MKLTLGGVEYRADLPDLYEVSIGEARAIKANTRMTISDWRVGLMTFAREDPDVLAAMVFLLRNRSRKPDDPEVDWREIDAITSRELAEGVAWEDADTEAVKRAQSKMDAAVVEAAERLLQSDGQSTEEEGESGMVTGSGAATSKDADTNDVE